MDVFGFIRMRSEVPEVRIADPDFNSAQIINAVAKAHDDNVHCMVFPELSISAYTCADLFQQHLLLRKVEEVASQIAKATENFDVAFAVGAPVMAFGKRYNCALMFYRGHIHGIVPKSYLPNYGEFYEKRWFDSGKNITEAEINFAGQSIPFGTDIIFNLRGVKIGIEICEDLWVPNPPSASLAMAGAEIILNLSASDDLIGKHDYLVSLISQQSARCRCIYAYSSAGWGESSTDLVFTGKAIIADDGNATGTGNDFIAGPFSHTRDVDIQKLKLDRSKFSTFIEDESISKRYRLISLETDHFMTEVPSEYLMYVNPKPFVPSDPLTLSKRCEEIVNIQSYGLMKRLDAIGCHTALVGISGGLDSTLALLVTVEAFKRLKLPLDGIIAVTMPGFATSSRTKNNAWKLMELLGVTPMEISIKNAVEVHFKDIGQDPSTFDATYENSQARERTQLLMDLANKKGGIVIGTGDMSELALGWCTYNGDQMSMYGVNASVPKTLVRHLVEWFASKSDQEISSTLLDICDTPISPELVPSSNDDIAQKTEDLVGPYELHDFFLFHFLRNSFEPKKIFTLARIAFKGKYSDATILKWLKVFYRRFFSQQFKRSCMPDGPKVGSVNLSPRGDWRMPSDAVSEMWLKQLDDIIL
ncbi:MAG: NAD(+) synthase [Muribaculaceae bacterium]|nr:NAD(+) synthase [Muribaculaceae bacterium]